MNVDRTTIRAWTQQGMPYKAPEGRGHEGSYNTSVALYWKVWNDVKDKQRFPEVDPLRALALAYFYFTVYIGPPNPHHGKAEALAMFPGIVESFYDESEIIAAMHYAIGYLEGSRSCR